MIPLETQNQTLQNPNLNGFNYYEPDPQKVNCFERKERMLKVGGRFFRGAKANIARAVFDFFLCRADNITGRSCHSIETISEFIGFSRQWVQKGLNILVEKKLILKTRRGLKKTNIHIINYKLVEEQQQKPPQDKPFRPLCNQPNSTDVNTVFSQSSLSYSKNISNTNRNTGFEDFELKKETQELVSLKNDPVETYQPESSAIKVYKERINCSKMWKKSIPDPTNREEEREFIRKDFYLGKKQNRILESSVSDKYMITSEYRQAYRRYIEDHRPPFKEYGEFWTQQTANRYFWPWLKGTLHMKKELESQGKRFFHYHDRQAYKENTKFLVSQSKSPHRKPQVEVQMVQAEPKTTPKIAQLAQLAQYEEKLWEEPKSIAVSISKAMVNIQHYEGEDSMKDKSIWNIFKGFKQEYKAPAVTPNIEEVEEVIAREPDKLRQGILKVCAKILPDVVFLKAEKTLKITRTEDEDEITFDILIEKIYSYEHKIRMALQEALVSAKEKRVYVRLIKLEALSNVKG